MKIEIKSRWDASVLFSIETENIKLAVEAAVKSKAYLRGAYLGGAYLRGAYLRGADLGGAYLRGADLGGADLGGAYLRGAYLGGAYLRGAYLRGADLGGADLGGADLRGAYLGGAYLGGAYLGGAYLGGAYLGGAKGINPYRCTPLLMLLDQPGAIVAYKLVNKKHEGPYNGGIKYIVGKKVECKDADTDVSEQCSAGINVADLPWCMKEWREGYKILTVQFTSADIAAIPTATDGKFRLHRCEVTGVVDLKKIGLIQEKGKAEANL